MYTTGNHLGGKKSFRKQVVPQDKMTSPRYIDPARNKNDIIPLQAVFTRNVSNMTEIIMKSLHHHYTSYAVSSYFSAHALSKLKVSLSHHIHPHPTPLQGQGQISANFSASLEWTLRDIRSS